MGHAWTKRATGHATMHVMMGADANKLLARRHSLELKGKSSRFKSADACHTCFYNHMRPPACVKLKRA